MNQITESIIRNIDGLLCKLRDLLMPPRADDFDVTGRDAFLSEFDSTLKRLRDKTIALRDECDRAGCSFIAVLSDAQPGGETGNGTVVQTANYMTNQHLLCAALRSLGWLE